MIRNVQFSSTQDNSPKLTLNRSLGAPALQYSATLLKCSLNTVRLSTLAYCSASLATLCSAAFAPSSAVEQCHSHLSTDLAPMLALRSDGSRGCAYSCASQCQLQLIQIAVQFFHPWCTSEAPMRSSRCCQPAKQVQSIDQNGLLKAYTPRQYHLQSTNAAKETGTT